MNPQEIKSLIEAGLDGAEAFVDGDGSHFVARVVSEQFAGLNMVKQHQLVYATLGDSVGGAIHALSLQTFTPDDWEKFRRLNPV